MSFKKPKPKPPPFVPVIDPERVKRERERLGTGGARSTVLSRPPLGARSTLAIK